LAYRDALDHIGFHNVKDEEREIKKQQAYVRNMCKKAFIARKLAEGQAEDDRDK